MSSPALDLFFSCDGIVDVRKIFVVNQIVAVIFAGKSFRYAFVSPMLNKTFRQVIRNTSVKNIPFRISDDIDIVMMLFENMHGRL